jgi:hypothetical protein
MEPSQLTEKRKEQVLEAPEACARLLRERFGARRVILFGSLAGQSPWHTQSGWRLPRFSMLIRRAAICCLRAQNWTWSRLKRSLLRCGPGFWGRYPCPMIHSWLCKRWLRTN